MQAAGTLLRVSFYAMIMVLKCTMLPIYLNFLATRQASL
jgi:hypothetical protein